MNSTMTLTGNAHVTVQRRTTLLVLAGALLMAGVWTRPVSALTWSVENVGAALESGRPDAIALDAGGQPHIVYSDSVNGRLKYARKLSTGSWIVQTVDSGLDVGRRYIAALALDASGQPHFSYNGPSRTVRYARRECYLVRRVMEEVCFWSIVTVGSGEGSSIALDSSNRPHISYVDDLGLQFPAYIKYAKLSTVGWSTETVDAFWSLGSEGNHTVIALDSGDLPHIGYRQLADSPPFEVAGQLKYARKSTTGSWSSEWIDLADHYTGPVSLVLDSSDRPHLSYTGPSAANHPLNYARKLSTGSWSIETVDSSSETAFASLALDSSNRPHISYIYRDSVTSPSFRVLKYASKTCFTVRLAFGFGTACRWGSEPIDSGGDVDLGATWLALDSNDRPHISYYDVTHDAPQYAHGF